MKRQIKNTFLNFSGSFLKPTNGIHIVNAHYMNPNIENDSGEHFIKQLENIKKHGQLIRIEEACDLIKKGKKVSNSLVAFTFDDGFKECYEVAAQILNSYGVNAAFFINPNFIECNEEYYLNFSQRVTVKGKKPMTWSQINDLHKRGNIIGAHTMDHLDLGKGLSETELYYQIVNCKNEIENKIGNNCNMFAFPYGRQENLLDDALNLINRHYEYIFSGTNYKHYFSSNNRVINRRHIEPFWPVSHLNYFLSVKKKW